MRILMITPNDQHEGFEYVCSGRENLGVERLLAILRAENFCVASRNENIPGGLATGYDDLGEGDVIGFSLPFWEYRKLYVKAINDLADRTDATLIAGGHAATIGARYFLAKCPGLLGVVMGEGEETFTELAKCLEAFRDCRGVHGLMTRDSYVPRRDLRGIDDLLFPARDELRLSLQTKMSVREALVESTRGCSYRCSFCSIPQYYKYTHGKRRRERSAENVSRELSELVAEFPNVNLISFTDDNFLGPNLRHHERAIRIARHIHSLNGGLGFEIVCRADAIERQLFAELASLGLVGVYLGIESAVQRILDSFQKGTSVEENLKAIRVLSDLGIACDIGFIAFLPGVSLNEVKQNLEFLKYIGGEFAVFVHPAAVFRRLREYPMDLGVSAIDEENDRNFASLDGPIKVLYEALDTTWHTQFERNFIRCEDTVVRHSGDFTGLYPQKGITARMLEIAFSFLRDLERSPLATSDTLLSGFGAKRMEQ